MIRIIRSLLHKISGWHTGAIRISDGRPLIMWCPVCKLAWEAGIHPVRPWPRPPAPRERPADR